MPRIEKSVFLSYRRTNVPWALNVYQDLTFHGFDVFIDFEGIGPGDFETIIVDNITSRAHFVLILTPSALERCNDPGDWLRREIEVAIESKRNIIPLMMDSFSFSSPQIAVQLTGKLASLRFYNGLGLSAEYFLASMEKLRNKFLNVTLAAVPQPASRIAQQAATEQKALANAAPPVRDEELTAQEYFEQGVASSDPDEEIRLNTEALRLKPRFPEAHINRAVARKAKGDLNGSLDDLNHAITLMPESAEAYYNRGTIRYTNGDSSGALQDYDQALLLKPDYAKAWYNRGLLKRDGRDLDGALLDYSQAIRLRPDFADAYSNRAITKYVKGNYDAAILDYDQAIRLQPNNAEAYFGRGTVQSAKGELDAALLDYDQAIRLKPDHISAYNNRGRTLRAKNSTEAALADLQQYLKLGGGLRDGDSQDVKEIIFELQKQLG